MVLSILKSPSVMIISASLPASSEPLRSSTPIARAVASEAAETVETMPVRFARLDAVDKKYDYYIAPDYRKDYTLQELCSDFRNFCCSRMGLFYEEKVIRLMFAG